MGPECGSGTAASAWRARGAGVPAGGSSARRRRSTGGLGGRLPPPPRGVARRPSGHVPELARPPLLAYSGRVSRFSRRPSYPTGPTRPRAAMRGRSPPPPHFVTKFVRPCTLRSAHHAPDGCPSTHRMAPPPRAAWSGDRWATPTLRGEGDEGARTSGTGAESGPRAAARGGDRPCAGKSGPGRAPHRTSSPRGARSDVGGEPPGLGPSPRTRSSSSFFFFFFNR